MREAGYESSISDQAHLLKLNEKIESSYSVTINEYHTLMEKKTISLK